MHLGHHLLYLEPSRIFGSFLFFREHKKVFYLAIRILEFTDVKMNRQVCRQAVLLGRVDIFILIENKLEVSFHRKRQRMSSLAIKPGGINLLES